jgi:hypothetical protein
MSTLLTIEAAFLSNSQVATAINLREIRGLQRTLANGQKKKFQQTLELSAKVVEAVNWFSSEEGKTVTAEAGIYWTNEQIGNKVFGWQKSYFYKVVKAGKLEATKVEQFNSLCDEAEARGEEPNRTLEGLLKFARLGGGETNSEAGGEESGEEGEESGEIGVEIRIPTIFTMTYKGGNKNVSIRINEAGAIATTNSTEEILEAIAFLTNSINQ